MFSISISRTINQRSIRFTFFCLIVLLGVIIIRQPLFGPEPGGMVEPGQSASLAVVPDTWLASVHENILQSEYKIVAGPVSDSAEFAANFQAINRKHNFQIYFAKDGPLISPLTNGAEETAVSWEWGMTLVSLGYADNLTRVETADLMASGNQVNYQRGIIKEWYINDKNGLEQGFILDARPPSNQTNTNLKLQLEINGNLIPTLVKNQQKIIFSNNAGADVIQFDHLAAFDANGNPLPTHFELYAPSRNQSLYTMQIVVDDKTAIYPITIDPLVTNPDWMVESNQSGAEMGFPTQGAGDVNADGFADVIVGARFYSNGQSEEGRAYVFYGSANGLSTTADWIAEGNQAGANFGRAVNTAGDVNGDGFDDIVVGATDYSGDGRVFVYYGGPDGLSCGGGCPVDADSAADWTAGGNQNGSALGRSVSTAGDVNDDGYDDILVSAWKYSDGQTSEGRVFAFYGSSNGFSCGGGCPVNANIAADWIIDGNQANTALGSMVASAGDVNGDGYGDVVTGGYGFNNGEFEEGMTFVYYGSSSGLPCGLGCPADAKTTADWSTESNQVGSRLGAGSKAGDVNSDGFDDLVVAADRYTNGESQEGMVFVFYGSGSGLNCGGGCPVDAFTAADWSAEGNQANTQLGTPGSLAPAGDFNGDYFDDFLVGARSFDHFELNEGLAFIFYGSATGLSCGAGCPVDAAGEADWLAELDNPGALLGISVDNAGDINGDGVNDVIIGASDYTDGESQEGAAFVYHGVRTVFKVFLPVGLN